MVGSFYDFKQDEKGKPVNYDIGNTEDFDSRVKKIQRGNFRDSVLRNFFKAPTTLYLSQVAIPDGRAEQGPTVFGVADKVKPSGWVVHYKARLTAPRDMNFRFVGVADDYLCASVDGRPRLVAVWGHAADDYYGWKPEAPSGEHPGPFRNHPITYGDWVRLRKGQEFDMDIAIGERPGGYMTFLLMLEEKDVTYKMSGARPILPLFSTEAIRPERKDQIIKGFGSYEFDWQNVPVFAPVNKKNDFGL